MGDRWSDANATIADGCVIVTPVESEELFCLSLIDGKLLWKMDRGENVYVAGMRDGKVLLVGRKQVQAINWPMAKPPLGRAAVAPARGVPRGEVLERRRIFHCRAPKSSASTSTKGRSSRGPSRATGPSPAI